MKVREFADGSEVTQALLVRDVEVRSRRGGGEYLKLTLGDRTGSVPALVWEDVADAREICRPGQVVLVNGRYTVHQRYGPQLAVQRIRTAREDEGRHVSLCGRPCTAPVCSRSRYGPAAASRVR